VSERPLPASSPTQDGVPLIVHHDDLPTYSPPNHSGTVNRRLIDPALNARVDMVLGVIEPGGTADRHFHDVEFQAIYVLGGRAKVTIGDAAPHLCEPGHVIRLPPGTVHEVSSLGPDDLRLVVLYSPPLAGPPIPA